jgi:hypothetical protein
MASSKSNECWAGPGWWINRSPHGFGNVHIPQAATTRYMQGAGLLSIVKFWTVTLLIAKHHGTVLCGLTVADG